MSNGSGGVAGADVTNVAITCTTNDYQVGGTVSGLASSGRRSATTATDSLVAELERLVRVPDQHRQRRQPTPSPSPASRPTRPRPARSTGGSGTVDRGRDRRRHRLLHDKQLRDRRDGQRPPGRRLHAAGQRRRRSVVSADGTFTFADPGAERRHLQRSRSRRSLPARRRPAPWAARPAPSGPPTVSSVTVNCSTNSYIVGGTVTGLTGSGLVIQNNGGGDLAISGLGHVRLRRPLVSGQPYAVTVKTQPDQPLADLHRHRRQRHHHQRQHLGADQLRRQSLPRLGQRDEPGRQRAGPAGQRGRQPGHQRQRTFDLRDALCAAA